MPEVASPAEAEALTVDMYQPPSPVTPESAPLTCGGWVSIPPLAEPILDESPHDESAQKEKSLFPSESGTEHEEPEHAKETPLRVPSISRMLYPATGSFAVMSRVAEPRHQPFDPGLEQEMPPETVASG